MSKATLFFVFQHKNELYIVDNNHVQDVPKPRELIRRVSTVEQCREIAVQMGLPVANDTARERTKTHTPEGIERIRQAKMGDNHPSRKNGVSEDHAKKISETMKGTRRGENNPMYGRRHSVETRVKMHNAWINRERRYWVSGPEGQRTTIPKSQPVPEGWQKGMYFDKYRPEELVLD